MKKLFLFSFITLIFTMNLMAVSFKKGSSELTPESYDVLDKLGQKLVTVLKVNPKIKIKFNGYTDDKGSLEKNINLSKKRAESVVNYIQSKYNIPQDNIIINGFGSKNPIASNKTEEGRRRNRRVEVLIGKRKITLSSVKRPVASVKNYKNNVQIQENNKNSWTKVSNYIPLFPLDKIQTSKDSEVTLLFNKKNELILSEDSLLTIYGDLDTDDFMLEQSKYHLFLEKGNAFNQFQKLKIQSFNIKTLSAGIEVFSKLQNIEVLKNKTTLISVYEGQVKATNNGKKIAIKAGYGARIKKGQEPENPIELPNVPTLSISNNGAIVSGEKAIMNIRGTNLQYILQISDTKKFDNLLYNKKIKGTVAYLDLKYGVYYARALSIDSIGLKSLFSKPYKFQVYRLTATQISKLVENSTTIVRKRDFLLKGTTVKGAKIFINDEPVSINKNLQFQKMFRLNNEPMTLNVKTILPSGENELYTATVQYMKDNNNAKAGYYFQSGFFLPMQELESTIKIGPDFRGGFYLLWPFHLQVGAGATFYPLSIIAPELKANYEIVIDKWIPYFGVKFVAFNFHPKNQLSFWEAGLGSTIGVKYRPRLTYNFTLSANYLTTFSQKSVFTINLGIEFLR